MGSTVILSFKDKNKRKQPNIVTKKKKNQKQQKHTHTQNPTFMFNGGRFENGHLEKAILRDALTEIHSKAIALMGYTPQLILVKYNGNVDNTELLILARD